MSSEMKKTLYALLFAVTSFGLTSCLEIAEEVTINKDGSGTYSTTVDATQLAEAMQMFAAMDTTGQGMPNMKHTLDSTFAENWEVYKTVEGISNIKIDSSTDYVYILTMDFKNVKALNTALDKGKKEGAQTDIYSWSKGKLGRKDGGLSELGDLGGESEEEEDMMKGMLGEMKYKLTFNLPSKVKKVSNANAVISDSKTQVTIETNFADLTSKASSLGCDIDY